MADLTPEAAATATDSDQDSLLARVSARPPTPDKCAVCLNNKQLDVIARIDSCAHTFCFACVLEWSKVRAICPLCKQPFQVITRERYSGEIVEEVRVQAAQRPATLLTNINDVLDWVSQNDRRSGNTSEIFRQMVYIEWLNTVQAIVRPPNPATRNSSLHPSIRRTRPSSSWSSIIPLHSIRRLLHRYLRQTTSDLRQSTIYSQSTRQTVAFRKHIYLNRLFIHSPLIGHNHDTLTVRDCSPAWYASNPACLHRLVPFLARELLALVWDDQRTIEHIIQEILTTIQIHEIRSNLLTRKLQEYLGQYTKHFLHEFYTFARCPYDLNGFDRHAQYPTITPSTAMIPPPVPIALDHDDGDEQTPIVLDETPDVSIHNIDGSSSPSQTTVEAQRRESSSSSECEIVEYVEPARERMSPTLIVLSEDESEESPAQAASSSTKRKHHHHRHHHHHRSKKPHTASVKTTNLLASVIVDDDDADERQPSQRTNSTEDDHER